MNLRAVGMFSSAVTLAALAVGATLDKPITAEVYVKSSGRATPLRGSLVKFDDTSFTLHVGADDRTLGWTDITPVTAFALKQKTIDRTKADQLLALGKFGWSIGAKDQAQLALKTATHMDPSLQSQVDAVTKEQLGYAVQTPTTKPAAKELISSGDSPPANKSTAATPPPGDSADTTGDHTKYVPATPEQIADAMARNRKQASTVETTIGVKLAEFETKHFLVFTDWDPRENDFLKANLEGAYTVVAKQFEMDPKDNVFVGKLPVYMLAKYSDFEAFAKQIDRFADVNNRTAGYYMGNTKGFGHMAMWKPNESLTGTSSMEDARRLWAYVLVHEFTHAFLARYRSNEFIPRWLNEGIAEVIAYSQFPYADRRRMARMMALQKADLSFMFDDANRPTGEYYPVMQSMAEMLVAAGKTNFLKMIDAIKDGQPPEKAMQAIYHVDYEQFVKEWRDWAKGRSDN